MQQEKKLDSNTVIGFVLIFLIFMGFTAYNYYTLENNPKPKTEQSQTENVSKTNVIKVETLKPKDSISSKVQQHTFENDKILAKVSSRGGQISEVLLKKYFAYDEKAKDHHKPLYLIKDGNASFGFTFKTKDGKIIDTRNLDFALTSQTSNQATFSAQVGTAKINFIYTLLKDYSIDFKVSTQNLFSIVSENKLNLHYFHKAFALEKGKSQENTYTEINYSYNNYSKDDYWTSSSFEEEEKIDWYAVKQQFFASVLEANSKFVNAKGTPKTIEDPKFLKEFDFSSEIAFQNEVNEQFTWHFFPLERDYLTTFDKQFERLIPFGWGIFGWLNVFFLWMYKFLGGFGIAAGWIIFWMTIIVKLITSPIMYKQHLQSAMMRVLKPELEELNAKHKDSDPLKKQQASMEIYRKAGVNPMAGCLPALLQLPIFVALYRFFPNIIELRGKSFLWADDLTAYDSVYSIPFDIPFYGAHVSLFTILYCAVLLIYTRMTANNIQQPQQEGMPDMKMLMYIMPLMFIFVLNSLASGLSWYYFVSNLLNILIILFIKQFMIDENKIHAKIQENKTKPKKQSKWQEKMQQMMEQAQQAQQKNQELQKKLKK